MHPLYERRLVRRLARSLRQFPAVALLGPRQCGKTTLAKAIAARRSAEGVPTEVLDLELPSDLTRLRDP